MYEISYILLAFLMRKPPFTYLSENYIEKAHISPTVPDCYTLLPMYGNVQTSRVCG